MSRRQRRTRVFSVSIAAVTALVGAGARAAEGLDLAFSDACTDLDRAQVRRIANIELRVRLAGQTTPLPSVTIDCAGVSATVRAENPGAPARERVVPFGGTALVARSRLLALAITEFVLTPDLAPEPPPAPDPVPAAPAIAPTVQVAAAAKVARAPLDLVALGYGRIWSAGWASAGAGLAYSGWFARYGLVRVDALFDHGVAQAAEGTAVANNVSVGASALLAVRSGGWQLGAGGGARVGATHLSGRPAEPTKTQGRAFLAGSGGPMGVLLVAPPRLGPVAFQVSLEGGRVTIPVDGRAGDMRSFAIKGFWFGATIGAGLGL